MKRDRKKEMGELLYIEDKECYQKVWRKHYSVVATLIWALVMYLFVLFISGNKMYIIGLVLYLALALPIIYEQFTITPFQIYEYGFIINIGKIIKYKDVEWVDIHYFKKVLEEKRPVYIKFKVKNRRFYYAFKLTDCYVVGFLKYALPRIKENGGKIMFTKEELRSAMEKYKGYKGDTSFIDEIPCGYGRGKLNSLKNMEKGE